MKPASESLFVVISDLSASAAAPLGVEVVLLLLLSLLLRLLLLLLLLVLLLLLPLLRLLLAGCSSSGCPRFQYSAGVPQSNHLNRCQPPTDGCCRFDDAVDC